MTNKCLSGKESLIRDPWESIRIFAMKSTRIRYLLLLGEAKCKYKSCKITVKGDISTKPSMVAEISLGET